MPKIPLKMEKSGLFYGGIQPFFKKILEKKYPILQNKTK